jgi:hypothetical protein
VYVVCISVATLLGVSTHVPLVEDSALLNILPISILTLSPRSSLWWWWWRPWLRRLDLEDHARNNKDVRALEHRNRRDDVVSTELLLALSQQVRDCIGVW